MNEQTTTTPTSTVTVSSSALRALLGAIALGASGDNSLPMLNGIMLHTDTHPRLGNVLVGSSTNRFVMLQGCVPAQGRLPERLFLRLRHASQVREVTRAYTTRSRAAAAQTEIVVAGSEVTVRQLALPMHSLGAVAITLPAPEGLHFPSLGKLWGPAVEKQCEPEPVTLDPQWIGLLAKLGASGLVGDVAPGVRLHHKGAHSVVIAHMGDVLSVLMMPMRISEPGNPVFLDIPEPGKPDDVLAEVAANTSESGEAA